MENMEYEKDDFIMQYIREKFNKHLIDTIELYYTNVDTLNKLNLVGTELALEVVDAEIKDLINNEEELGDNVLLHIQNIYKKLLIKHLYKFGIYLIKDITFVDLTNLLDGINKVFLVDPDLYANITAELENDLIANEEIFANIVSEYGLLETIRINELVTDIDDDFMELLTNHMIANAKPQQDDTNEVINFLINVDPVFGKAKLVEKISSSGYSETIIEEYLSDVYSIIDSHSNNEEYDIIPYEVAAALYLGINTRFKLLESVDLFFNLEIVIQDENKFNKAVKDLNALLIKLDTKV